MKLINPLFYEGACSLSMFSISSGLRYVSLSLIIEIDLMNIFNWFQYSIYCSLVEICLSFVK